MRSWKAGSHSPRPSSYPAVTPQSVVQLVIDASGDELDELGGFGG